MIYENLSLGKFPYEKMKTLSRRKKKEKVSLSNLLNLENIFQIFSVKYRNGNKGKNEA